MKKYSWYGCWLALLLCLNMAHAQQNQPGLLTGRITQVQLSQWLDTQARWHAIPAYENRQAWQQLPTTLTSSWIQAGEAALQQQWQPLLLQAYLAYEQTGRREPMETPAGHNVQRLKSLVLAELAEGKGRFVPEIANGLFFFCEMSTWAASAHLPLQRQNTGVPDVEDPIIDIAGSNLAVLLAYSTHLLRQPLDAMSPAISRRVQLEIQRRMLQPYYTRRDFWWMGYQTTARPNNWTIWCNYNLLQCILLMETDPARRLQGIYKTIETTDLFLDTYEDDGVCEEGPSYWNRAAGYLQPYLEILQHITGGRLQAWQLPRIKAMGRFIMLAHVAGNYYFNYSDAPARLRPDAGIVYRYGAGIGDSALMAFGATLARQQGWPQAQLQHDYLQVLLQNAVDREHVLAFSGAQPDQGNHWLPKKELAIIRSSTHSEQGWYLGIKAGHNGWSHGHNDAGSAIVFYNGHPVLIDVGREAYRKQSFGKDRYSNWLMQSAYHNLPLINGEQQQDGKAFSTSETSFEQLRGLTRLRTNLAGAYPPAAGVQRWLRSYSLHAGGIDIEDEGRFSHNNGPTALHFMTCIPPQIFHNKIVLPLPDGTGIAMNFMPQLLEPAVEEIPITDAVTLQSWPDKLYRIVLRWKQPTTRLQHRLRLTAVAPSTTKQ